MAGGGGGELSDVVDRARVYSEAARADNTRRAYASDWEHFDSWCASHGVSSLPARSGTVAAYLVDAPGTLKVSTLARRIASIKAAHQYAGRAIDLGSAAFRDVWAGIRRVHGGWKARKRALVTGDLRKAVLALPERLIGLRDRALLLIGFASAMRRSELAILTIGEGKGHRISFVENGLLIELGASKADQEGDGAVIGIPFGSHSETCPVRALRAWLDASGITNGPIFRPITRHGFVGSEAMTDKAVALVIKRAIFRAILADGYSHQEATAFVATVGGHSLRAGFVTSADAAGAPIAKIMAQARHARFETTKGCIREADAFRDNAASYLGL